MNVGIFQYNNIHPFELFKHVQFHIQQMVAIQNYEKFYSLEIIQPAKLLSNIKLEYKRISITKMATILFDSSKNELFKLTDNYKTVNRKLKANYKTET